MSSLCLIADSGSTKTDWVLLSPNAAPLAFQSQGINPMYQERADILRLFGHEVLPHLPLDASLSEIHFYGAGCAGKGKQMLQDCLHSLFPHVAVIEVDTDLVGAAKALFAEAEGVACILGTGSNSGLWDGTRLTANISPLGYILGDEGSGATLGRRLVGDVFKQQLPEALCQAFVSETGLTPAEVVQRVYREPLANRFLASLTPFLYAHRSEPSIHALLLEEFSRFFRRNVCLYGRPDLPVSFVGSIAWFFAAEVKEAASEAGYEVGRILRRPIEAIIHG